MGKLKYGIAAVAIVGITGTSIPYITKSSIENNINKNKTNWKKMVLILKLLVIVVI